MDKGSPRASRLWAVGSSFWGWAKGTRRKPGALPWAVGGRPSREGTGVGVGGGKKRSLECSQTTHPHSCLRKPINGPVAWNGQVWWGLKQGTLILSTAEVLFRACSVVTLLLDRM